MSLSYLRDAITQHLQVLADAQTTNAINMKPMGGMGADQYAMIQVDRLARASALLEAINVVTKEYKRLTESGAAVGNDTGNNAGNEVAGQPQKDEPVYG